MQRGPVVSLSLCLSAAVLSILLLGCASAPELVGRWQEIGRTATLEFREDGSFAAVDNQGMAVSGTYTRLDRGRVRFEILHPGPSPEVVVVTITVAGEELTLVAEDPGEVERYRRMRPGPL